MDHCPSPPLSMPQCAATHFPDYQTEALIPSHFKCSQTNTESLGKTLIQRQKKEMQSKICQLVFNLENSDKFGKREKFLLVSENILFPGKL